MADELNIRNQLLKYGRNGVPELRSFSISPDNQFLKWVGKRGAEDSVNLAGLTDIWLGQQSDVFKMLPSNGLAIVSFSLVCPERTLDLVARSVEERKRWISEIQAAHAAVAPAAAATIAQSLARQSVAFAALDAGSKARLHAMFIDFVAQARAAPRQKTSNSATVRMMDACCFDPSNDTFTVRKIPVPEPGPLDVLVRVSACGLNPVDAKAATWKSVLPGMTSSHVCGLDVSGVIEAVGEDVEGWAAGDAVLYHGSMYRSSGGFAEYAIQDCRTLLAHPRVSPVDAAATPCAGWTSFRALHDKLKVTSADTLLITGGSGGTGSFAVQLAKAIGVRTIIATCSEKNVDFVKSLGATHVLDYTKDSELEKKVLDICEGHGVSMALDTVGDGQELLCGKSVKHEGHILSIATLLQAHSLGGFNEVFLKGLSLHHLSLGRGYLTENPADLDALVSCGKRFNELLEAGLVSVPRKQIIGIQEVPGALQGLLSKRTVGKIVLQFPEAVASHPAPRALEADAAPRTAASSTAELEATIAQLQQTISSLQLSAQAHHDAPLQPSVSYPPLPPPPSSASRNPKVAEAVAAVQKQYLEAQNHIQALIDAMARARKDMVALSD